MSKSNRTQRYKRVCVIPARSGSKGIPKKNIKFLGGYPLIAYSIMASRRSKEIERTIVSTDSREIADIALFYGAEVPFMRPKEISTDASLDIEFIKHLLKWFGKNEGYQPEYIVHLRPTTPIREPELIDHAVKKLLKDEEATSLRSVHETRESPYKLFEIKDGYLRGLFPGDGRPEYYNLPRQMFPPVYAPNGYVDIVKSSVVMNYGSLHGERILPFVTPVVVEVDRLEDFEQIEFALGKSKIFDSMRKQFKKEALIDAQL